MVDVATVYEHAGQRLEVTATAEQTGGALHEMRGTWPPGSAPPPSHLHPAQDERFEVLEGVLRFVVDGVQRDVEAGSGVDVPAGAVHQVSNPGGVPAVALWQTRPALRTGAFHDAIARARAGGDLAELLAVVDEYADVFVLAPMPAVEG